MPLTPDESKRLSDFSELLKKENIIDFEKLEKIVDMRKFYSLMEDQTIEWGILNCTTIRLFECLSKCTKDC
jgi:hypothetical protein